MIYKYEMVKLKHFKLTKLNVKQNLIESEPYLIMNLIMLSKHDSKRGALSESTAALVLRAGPFVRLAAAATAA